MDLNLLAALVFGFTLVGFVVFGLVTNTAKGNRMNVADQGGRPTLFIDCDDTLYRLREFMHFFAVKSVSESGLILRITLSSPNLDVLPGIGDFRLSGGCDREILGDLGRGLVERAEF
eukprot:296849-Amorphochlora_amoeboformis.AAC.1